MDLRRLGVITEFAPFLTFRWILLAIFLNLWRTLAPVLFLDGVHDRWYMKTTSPPGCFLYVDKSVRESIFGRCKGAGQMLTAC